MNQIDFQEFPYVPAPLKAIKNAKGTWDIFVDLESDHICKGVNFLDYKKTIIDVRTQLITNPEKYHDINQYTVAAHRLITKND